MTTSTELFKATLNQLLDSTRAYVAASLKIDDELALQSDVIFHKINQLRKEINAVTEDDMKD